MMSQQPCKILTEVVDNTFLWGQRNMSISVQQSQQQESTEEIQQQNVAYVRWATYVVVIV
jgi:hypothetical protein